jgi:hypothetical protein
MPTAASTAASGRDGRCAAGSTGRSSVEAVIRTPLVVIH